MIHDTTTAALTFAFIIFSPCIVAIRAYRFSGSQAELADSSYLRA
jgi:hypothetical protein